MPGDVADASTPFSDGASTATAPTLPIDPATGSDEEARGSSTLQDLYESSLHWPRTAMGLQDNATDQRGIPLDAPDQEPTRIKAPSDPSTDPLQRNFALAGALLNTSDQAPRSLERAADQAQQATHWQAATLGFTLDEKLPFVAPDHETPSQAVFTLLDRHDATPTQDEMQAIRTLDDLAEEPAAALTDLIDAFITLETASEAAYADALIEHLTDPQAAWPALSSFTLTGQGSTDPGDRLSNAGINLAPVLTARNHLLDTIVALDAALDTTENLETSNSQPDVHLPPVITINLDEDKDDTYTEDVALLIENGGNNTYHNNAGGSGIDEVATCSIDEPQATAALIDLGRGDNRYGNAENPRRCGANGGGAYTGGTGFLLDAGGNNTYTASEFGTNGGAGWGATGFLLDAGEQAAEGTYLADGVGTNGGGTTGGVGMLLDAGPNTTYEAGRNGANGGAVTGVGFLFDSSETDTTYVAESRGTNGGGVRGSGFLLDEGGNDVYIGGDNGVNGGGGGAAGVGFLFDRAGEDRYEESLVSCSDCSHLPKGMLGAQIDSDDTTPRTSQEELIVDDDGEDCPQASHESIQAAVTDASPGATVQVCPGSYEERVTVDTPGLALQGVDAGAVHVEGSGGSQAFVITAPLVTVEGFTITGTAGSSAWDAGILIEGAGATITHNTIAGANGIGLKGTYEQTPLAGTVAHNNIDSTGNSGIALSGDVQGTQIHDNTIDGGGTQGILLTGAQNVTLTDNHVMNVHEYPPSGAIFGTGYGIISVGSSDVTMTNNTLVNNRYNLGVIDGHETHDIDRSNTVDGKPVFFLHEANDRVFDEGTSPQPGTIYCFSCVNVTVRNLTFTDERVGVMFVESEEILVRNNTVSDVRAGIIGRSVSDTSALDNEVTDAFSAISIDTMEGRGGVLVENNTARNLDVSGGIGVIADDADPFAGSTDPIFHEMEEASEAIEPVLIRNNTVDSGMIAARRDPGAAAPVSVTENTITNSASGLFTADSYGIEFVNNTVTDSFHAALAQTSPFGSNGGTDHVWQNNTFTNSTFGMSLYQTTSQTLRNNTMTDNAYNLRLYAGGYDHDIDESNLVDGKPVVYLVNEQDRVIDETTDAGYMAAVDSENITVRNLDLTSNGEGILLKNTVDSTIENVTIDDPLSEGIFAFDGSHRTTIRNTTVVDAMQGISVTTSNQAHLANNDVSIENRSGFENPYPYSVLNAYPAEVNDPYASGVFVFGDEANITGNTVRNTTDGIHVQTGTVGTSVISDNVVMQPSDSLGLDWDGTNRFHRLSHNDGIRLEPLVGATESPEASGVLTPNEHGSTVEGNTLVGPGDSGIPSHGVSVYTEGNPAVILQANEIRSHSTAVHLDALLLTETITVQDNLIQAAADAGVHVTEQTPDNVKIDNNKLPPGADHGVYYGNAEGTLDATNNYWGATNGPSSAAQPLVDPATGALADGDGSAVSASSQDGESNIRFDPWLKAPPGSS